MAANPILVWADDSLPLTELKMGVVFYLASPPNRDAVRKVYSAFMRRFEAKVCAHRSTTAGQIPKDWNQASRNLFEKNEISNLYKTMDWGWAFSDTQSFDSWMFMFHGYRPYSEPEKASFFRFDFDWQVDPKVVFEFSLEVMEAIDFIWGSAGYYLQGRADLRHISASYDHMFGIARRYLGAEARNIDVTVQYAKGGFACVNWLTMIGASLGAASSETIVHARSVAYRSVSAATGEMFQADERPLLGDQNRLEVMHGYRALAAALEPLQLKAHASFGGELWTSEEVIDYLYRFTRP